MIGIAISVSASGIIAAGEAAMATEPASEAQEAPSMDATSTSTSSSETNPSLSETEELHSQDNAEKLPHHQDAPSIHSETVRIKTVHSEAVREAVPATQPQAAQPAETQPDVPSTRYTEHTVRHGETLTKLAKAYRVQLGAIALLNDLRPDAVLRAGQTIKIPGIHRTSTSTHPSESKLGSEVVSTQAPSVPRVAASNRLPALATDGYLKTKQEVALGNLREKRNRLQASLAEFGVEESTRPFELEGSDRPKTTSFVTAPQGDRTGSYLTESDLTESNLEVPPLNAPMVLERDWQEDPQKLNLDFAEGLEPSQVEAEAASTPSAESATTLYAVRSGDTVDAIARRYGVSRESIVAANDLSDPHFIKSGQQLLIPQTRRSGLSAPTLASVPWWFPERRSPTCWLAMKLLDKQQRTPHGKKWRRLTLLLYLP
ncbi:MAG: LysM peptidoglycan-binding domain-containing protein [Coleofasciculaceae cyanobacterium SM2_3_26]|nr:LysM peptidoglycan-binding domain-containing protein [Coleofasciculaceae cyanobacterium SM2_3_26]